MEEISNLLKSQTFRETLVGFILKHVKISEIKKHRLPFLFSRTSRDKYRFEKTFRNRKSDALCQKASEVQRNLLPCVLSGFASEYSRQHKWFCIYFEFFLIDSERTKNVPIVL